MSKKSVYSKLYHIIPILILLMFTFFSLYVLISMPKYLARNEASRIINDIESALSDVEQMRKEEIIEMNDYFSNKPLLCTVIDKQSRGESNEFVLIVECNNDKGEVKEFRKQLPSDQYQDIRIGDERNVHYKQNYGVIIDD